MFQMTSDEPNWNQAGANLGTKQKYPLNDLRLFGLMWPLNGLKILLLLLPQNTSALWCFNFSSVFIFLLAN